MFSSIGIGVIFCLSLWLFFVLAEAVVKGFVKHFVEPFIKDHESKQRNESKVSTK